MKRKSVFKKKSEFEGWFSGLWLAAGAYFQKLPPAGRPSDPSRQVYLFILESQSSSPRRLTLSHRFCLVTRSHNSDERKSIQINSEANRMAADGRLGEGRCDVIHREAPLLQQFWREGFVQGQGALLSCLVSMSTLILKKKKWLTKCEIQSWDHLKKVNLLDEQHMFYIYVEPLHKD